MPAQYRVQCDCASVGLPLTGEPVVRGFCHCEDCRSLLKIPYHSINAWEQDGFSVEAGEALLAEYPHPTLDMKRLFCAKCGETLFNTNKMGWRVVSRSLIRKCYENTLPEALPSQSHFYYGRRMVDVDDDFPKIDSRSGVACPDGAAC